MLALVTAWKVLDCTVHVTAKHVCDRLYTKQQLLVSQLTTEF